LFALSSPLCLCWSCVIYVPRDFPERGTAFGVFLPLMARVLCTIIRVHTGFCVVHAFPASWPCIVVELSSYPVSGMRVVCLIGLMVCFVSD